MSTFVSDISGKEIPAHLMIPGNSIRMTLLNYIRKQYPDFDGSKKMSLEELNQFRQHFMADYLKEQVGELNVLEEKVLNSLSDKTLLTDKLDDDKNENEFTYGQRVADSVASFGGSWTFIISFMVFIVIWILSNVYLLANKGFDPYPFILLNLILSCIASLQAPVIMMSQNRQEEKDRERAKKDYMINLKSELEIRFLHEKIDHLIMHQQQHLLEIQQIQIEMMQDILRQVEAKPNSENV